MNASVLKILEAVEHSNHGELIAWLEAHPRHQCTDEEEETYMLVDAVRKYKYNTARLILNRADERAFTAAHPVKG